MDIKVLERIITFFLIIILGIIFIIYLKKLRGVENEHNKRCNKRHGFIQEKE